MVHLVNGIHGIYTWYICMGYTQFIGTNGRDKMAGYADIWLSPMVGVEIRVDICIWSSKFLYLM